MEPDLSGPATEAPILLQSDPYRLLETAFQHNLLRWPEYQLLCVLLQYRHAPEGIFPNYQTLGERLQKRLSLHAALSKRHLRDTLHQVEERFEVTIRHPETDRSRHVRRHGGEIPEEWFVSARRTSNLIQLDPFLQELAFRVQRALDTVCHRPILKSPSRPDVHPSSMALDSAAIASEAPTAPPSGSASPTPTSLEQRSSELEDLTDTSTNTTSGDGVASRDAKLIQLLLDGGYWPSKAAGRVAAQPDEIDKEVWHREIELAVAGCREWTRGRKASLGAVIAAALEEGKYRGAAKKAVEQEACSLTEAVEPEVEELRERGTAAVAGIYNTPVEEYAAKGKAWDEALMKIRSKLIERQGEASALSNFNTWFRSSMYLASNEEVDFIGVPNAYFRSWLEEDEVLCAVVEEASREAELRVRFIEVEDRGWNLDLAAVERLRGEIAREPEITKKETPAVASDQQAAVTTVDAVEAVESMMPAPESGGAREAVDEGLPTERSVGSEPPSLGDDAQMTRILHGARLILHQELIRAGRTSLLRDREALARVERQVELAVSGDELARKMDADTWFERRGPHVRGVIAAALRGGSALLRSE